MSFRARWFLLLVVGAAAGVMIVAGVILAPRIRRQWKRDDLVRELATARARQDESACRRAASALVGFESAEALLALIDDFRAAPSSPGTEERMLDAVELFATRPEPRDPRPRAALEALAQDSNPTLRRWGLYLLEELANPTHAQEPLGFARPWALVRCDARDPLRSVRAATTMKIEAGALEERINRVFNVDRSPDAGPWLPEATPSLPEDPLGEDTPWRMLVRIASRVDARVTFDGQKISLVPRSHWDGDDCQYGTAIQLRSSGSSLDETLTLKPVAPAVLVEDFRTIRFDRSCLDAEKRFRALASLNGLRLVRKDPTMFEAYETLPPQQRIARIVAGIADGNDELPRFLLEHSEPQAFVALVDAATRKASNRTDSNEDVLREGFELFAMTRSTDARVVAALKKLETDPSPRRRFLARYLEEELGAPTFLAPPAAFVGKPLVTIPEGASVDEALAIVSRATSVPIAAEEGKFEQLGGCVWRAIIDDPWRALVRLAQSVDARIVVGSSGVRLVARKRVRLCDPPGRLDAVPDILISDLARGLRAFRFALEDVAPAERVAQTLILIRGREVDELASEAVRVFFWDLAYTDAPEGCCALAHLFGEWPLGSSPCGPALERSVRLQLADAPAPTVCGRLVELTGSEPRESFFGFYLLDLLLHPPSPAPPVAFSGSERVVVDLDRNDRVSLADAVAPIVSVVGPVVDISPRCANQTVHAPSFTDRPWRALLRIALEANDTLVVSGDRVMIEKGKRPWSGRPSLEARLSDLDRPVTVVPPASLKCPWSDDDDLRAIYGDLDPERALRALAKLNGCEVREKEDGTLEVRTAAANEGR